MPTEPDLLRFLTCGSVDDGKSTLIGRLLYESGRLPDDQLAALEADSKRVGTRGGDLDFALLVDGLTAEREQGITIDVAYRHFGTARRRFVVADTPGHEQYTRNTVTGASTAEAAVLLVDARAGVVRQTRRHTHLVGLLGIRRVALAVNKLDLVDFARPVFDRIAAEYRAVAAGAGITEVSAVPVCALDGDNVVTPSPRTPWYAGPTLLDWLESVPVDDQAAAGPLRVVVQWVNRPGPDFRGFSGRVVGGSVRPGDRVVVLPAGKRATVARLVTYDGELDVATAGQSVTVVLAEPVDVGRGDLLAAVDDAPVPADRFEADLIWMDEQDLRPGRQYLAKIGARTLGLTVDAVAHRLDVTTRERVAATGLRLNEIGLAEVRFAAPVAADPYTRNRDTGGFLLIDRLTNATAGAGLLRGELRRPTNVRWQALDVDQAMRSALNGHRPCVVWFTGLSGAGKSTIANVVERRLHVEGRHTMLLDGDNVRHGLNRDLGFTATDRVENIRRVAEVAGLMVQAGLIVLVAFISPFRAERELARGVVGSEAFREVFVDTPLPVAEQRDPKGLYAKARRGELPDFTGIDSPYEPPLDPDLRIDTTTTDPDEAATLVIDALRAAGIV
ncbi:sulfate adenylyltransferase subunit CysN [Pseudonocardia lacus]|uniref:sulfate adenylyltransferase subunit CysN n=1 Tax=Pseudonocardia lacus TaxID=2835865 RepID=UPI0027E300E2|nr:sulfate adenylyltransferase subunit CysN [Pseudonocardia lacus]